MMSSAHRIYVCTPYQGEDSTKTTMNLYFARAVALEVTLRGYTPVVPHLLYTQFLEDADPLQREVGLLLGRSDIRSCARLVFSTPPWYLHAHTGEHIDVSRGMQGDIEEAKRHEIPCHHWQPGSADLADLLLRGPLYDKIDAILVQDMGAGTLKARTKLRTILEGRCPACAKRGGGSALARLRACADAPGLFCPHCGFRTDSYVAAHLRDSSPTGTSR